MGASPEMAGQATMGNGDRERIALRAYELYLERGRADGQAEEDWYTPSASSAPAIDRIAKRSYGDRAS